MSDEGERASELPFTGEADESGEFGMRRGPCPLCHQRGWIRANELLDLVYGFSMPRLVAILLAVAFGMWLASR